MDFGPPSTDRSLQMHRRAALTTNDVDPSLIHRRISTIYPSPPPGADIAFWGEAWEGGTFYCKADKDGRPIRATEWLFTSLANQVGIATAPCSVIENDDGETFFGSLDLTGTASIFDVRDFLSKRHRGDFGQPSEWPGQHLSGLYAYDMFVGNPDRSIQNFMLRNDGLNRVVLAIDFASARLADLSGYNFPIESDATVHVGRFLRERQGFYVRSAYEMIDLIAGVPAATIERFLREMPVDWLTKEQGEGICEHWSRKKFHARLMALRSGLADGSLL